MFIGIDLGTSSIKTILIDENQKIIGNASISLNLSNPQSGFYEQEPDSWFTATLKCFEKLEKEFKSLWDLLEVFCIDFIDEGLFTESMLEDEQSEFMKSYASCRTQAQKLLTKLGWTNKDPIWTSQKLLDDYSWDR